MHFYHRLLSLPVLLLGAATLAFAQPAPVDPAAQLREALRATTIQLRTAQGDLATAQAERDQTQSDLDALQKRFTALEKVAASDRTSAQTNLAKLNADLTRKDSEAARLADNLKRTLDARDQASALAGKTAEELTATEQLKIEADREISTLRGQNRALFALGNEILTRYENYGLGKAITAREPFTQLTRVKLQTLVQSYADALEDQRAKLPAATDPATP